MNAFGSNKSTLCIAIFDDIVLKDPQMDRHLFHLKRDEIIVTFVMSQFALFVNA